MKSSTTGPVEFVSWVWIVQHVLSVCFRRKLSGPLKLLSDSVDWRPTSDPTEGVTLISFGGSKIEFNLFVSWNFDVNWLRFKFSFFQMVDFKRLPLFRCIKSVQATSWHIIFLNYMNKIFSRNKWCWNSRGRRLIMDCLRIEVMP